MDAQSASLKIQCKRISTRNRLGVRSRGVPLGALLLGGQLFRLALGALRRHVLPPGTALRAYGFGLRHAVDADHITAVDNVTRKLMQEGERPVTVGSRLSCER